VALGPYPIGMNRIGTHRHLVLASSSPYRASLLQRLGVAFEQRQPAINESRHPEEDPHDYVLRLARAKARAVTGSHTEAGSLIIGSDQVCVGDDGVVGKPADEATARQQLRWASARRLTFVTAVAVLDTAVGHCEATATFDDVVFRDLDDDTIERYIRMDQPLDCAGSFRAEGLGITLFEAVYSSDPTSLIGLPLISVTALLRQHGLRLP